MRLRDRKRSTACTLAWPNLSSNTKRSWPPSFFLSTCINSSQRSAGHCGVEGFVRWPTLCPHRRQRGGDIALRQAENRQFLGIDIDLERRRISLSLKQANEGHEVEIEAFDPTQYGMAARYDAEGNFIYPEGFDPDTQEWKPGFDSQREEWERQYQEAQTRFLAHKKQKAEAKAADAAAPDVAETAEAVEVAAE